MLAIIGASGKLGGATLSALLSHKLAAPSSIVAITSSQPGSPTWEGLAAKGVRVRHGTFDDPATLASALRGCARFFLVSTPRIALDFHDAPEGQGRERHHRAAVDAALAAGVRHVYYASLAFASPSKAGVMRAHIRTEAYLASLAAAAAEIEVTVVRQGLYNESWPLYLGYYDPAGDERGAVALAGDGPICWTAIADLGLGNALVLAAPAGEYAGRTFYLSAAPGTASTLADVAALVGKARGREVRVEIVGRKAYEDFYVRERGRDAPAVEWWSHTYAALEDGECLIDDPTLTRLLESVGRKPIPLEETIAAMVTAVDKQ